MRLTDEVKVSLVTGVCILALAITSKYVLRVELDFISQYGPVWLFMVYIAGKDKAGRSKVSGSALFWSAAIIVVTLAILTVYAI